MIKMIFTLRNDLSLCRLCYEQDGEIKEVKAADIYIFSNWTDHIYDLSIIDFATWLDNIKNWCIVGIIADVILLSFIITSFPTVLTALNK